MCEKICKSDLKIWLYIWLILLINNEVSLVENQEYCNIHKTIQPNADFLMNWEKIPSGIKFLIS